MPFSDDAFFSRRAFLQASATAVLSAKAVMHPRVALAEPAGAAKGTASAARYITARLAQHGADILFGVPGATCDPLFAAAASTSGVSVVVASSDLEAGYAADGFARMRGLGAVSVTYGVGTMSLIGVIAGAYAERSPIVVVNGGPTKLDLKLQREHQTLFSHSTGKEHSDLTMFREVTAYAERAESKEDVARVVDEAIATALRERRPVYIEIPKDVWDAPVGAPGATLRAAPPSSGREAALAARILERLGNAKRPLLLLGIELQRYGLAEQAAALVRKLGIPYATTMLAKAVIPETTTGFAGVYIGANSVPAVRELVDQSDTILALGCVFGRQYRELVTKSAKSLVSAGGGKVRSGSESTPAALGALVDAALAQTYVARAEHATRNTLSGRDFAARRKSVPKRTESSGLSYDAVLGTISDYLDDAFAVLTDTSLSMYPAADLNIAAKGAFVCNSVWQAIGFSVGAAVGVALASGKRPLVICGDGGFQMTAQALSTMARAGLKSIVVVLDNGIYGIEQFLLEPRFFAGGPSHLPYVGLNRWSYPDLARALGFKQAETITSIAELKRGLDNARGASGPVLLSVAVPPRDLPAQLVKEPA
ncbi:MAG: thiamine pyrophosphate-dependent enzyme [Myxococcota bacterium]